MPILIVLVRAAIALATIIGADSTERSGAPCNSASHTASRPTRSAVSTSASAWSKAALSAPLAPWLVIGGNSMKLPNSIAADLQEKLRYHHGRGGAMQGVCFIERCDAGAWLPRD